MFVITFTFSEAFFSKSILTTDEVITATLQVIPAKKCSWPLKKWSQPAYKLSTTEVFLATD